MVEKKEGMTLSVSLNLDDLWTDSEWGSTVGELIREALKAEIKAEIKRAVKNDKKFKQIINKFKDLAIKEIVEKVSD